MCLHVNAEKYLIPSVYHSTVIIIHSISVVRRKVHYVSFFGVWNKSAFEGDKTIKSTSPGTLVTKYIFIA